MTEVTSSREVLLTRTLVQLADTLVEGFDIVDLFTFLAARCIEILDVTAAGLMRPQQTVSSALLPRPVRRCTSWRPSKRNPTRGPA